MLENISEMSLPGIQSKQIQHLFGSRNKLSRWMTLRSKDDIDVIEECFSRVKYHNSEKSTFFASLDRESWFLIDAWSHVYTGLDSRRRIVAGIINATGIDIQIKQSKVEEGGSPCYKIPSSDYDHDQSILYPGGALLLFAWGTSPSFKTGKVLITVESNSFVLRLCDRISGKLQVQALTGFQVKFLEKSYDDNGWWAKYWILVKKRSA